MVVERYVDLARTVSRLMMKRYHVSHPLLALKKNGRYGSLNCCVDYVIHGIGCRYVFSRSDDATIIDVDYYSRMIILDPWKVMEFRKYIVNADSDEKPINIETIRHQIRKFSIDRDTEIHTSGKCMISIEFADM